MSYSVAKKCNYHSFKNCFIYLNNKQKDILNEQDIIELKYDNGKSKAYFSLLFSNIGRKDDDCIFLNGSYAEKLKIKNDDQVSLTKLNRDRTYASSVIIQPISFNDWEILELNTDTIQDILLNQIRVVFKEQIFPIWIDNGISVFVKTISFEPSGQPFICLNQMTRVVVDTPKAPSSNDSKQEKTFAKYEPKPFDFLNFNNNHNFIVQSVKNKCSSNLDLFISKTKFSFKAKVRLNNNPTSKCSTITTITISRNSLQKILNFKLSENQTKFLVSLKLFLTPMFSVKYKEIMKRISQALESSYGVDYVNLLTTTNQSEVETFGLLNLVSDDCGEDLSDGQIFVDLSQFLIMRCGLSSLSFVRISSLSLDDLLACSSDSLTLRTDYENANIVNDSFVKFIDESASCLCPLIFSNEQIVEISFDDEIIKCQFVLPKKFIAINSNSLSEIKINIDNKTKFHIPELLNIAFSPNKFEINICKSSWFDANVQQIIDHFETNLYSTSNEFLSRNIVLQGAKCSGKTTICKYICNEISSKESSIFYQFVNCQYLMGKATDAINEQLKLVYNECMSHGKALVVLDNFDFLLENVNSETDPNAKLYCHQLIEILKEILLKIWKRRSSVVTIITSTLSINELPTMFHCVDEHGLFTAFPQIKPPNKAEITEIVKNLLELSEQHIQFDDDLLRAFSEHAEGCVFKDIEKLIQQIIFEFWSQQSKKAPEERDTCVKLDDVRNVLYNYKNINMLDTNYYKAQSSLGWQMIGGLAEAKKMLVERIIWPIKYENFYRELSMKQFSSVLLYGPSGCGKTLIASALANESKLNFISVKGPELLSKYIGTSEQNVRELFRKAEKAKPCVIFFDEFDALAPKRGHDSTGVTDRVVNQLLTQLDGVEQLNGVYLLAASSRPDLIDTALLRPGRIDNYIYIGYPTQEEIREMIEIYCKKVKLDESLDLNEIAGACEHFSGADIKSLVCDALIKAFHRVFEKQSDENDEDKWDVLYKMKGDSKNSQELVNSIVITREDLILSVNTIKSTINVRERQKLHQSYLNWKETKNFSEANTQKKARATLA